ncbi:polyketide cyclase SnoaL-like domain-containing protein [Lentinula aciculospora]|uniref:Polyketide cyclase SnoaL-like domain-containing protein n=1 Tax=Lentinula aciculospora TaxID=153920 RepID=A0A9W9DDS4_9AGAR|nr:polyketide cyclase SnoaL-like domain-containing protein [Lentinula aciculospora]
MDSLNLEDHYRQYISYLNDRKTHDLSDFVHEELTYNDKPITRVDYQNYIADDIARIPDLYFDIHHLIVSDNHVASRIQFNCTPMKDFRGNAPNGEKISFVEHVFYQFEDGKIRQVWSLLDDRAIDAQMKSTDQ